MIRRREGQTIGQPPKYLDYEDDTYKVLEAIEPAANGGLIYLCECKLCGHTHKRTSKQLQRGSKARECKHTKAWNWTGLDRWDGIVRRTYGITLEEYNEMLKDQENGCKLCGKTEEEEGRRLAIDHCHESGKVRGILCSDCNIGLGKFKDNKEVMQKAIDYLKYSTGR